MLNFAFPKISSQGKKLGRPRALDEQQQDDVVVMRNAGHALTHVAKTMGVSRSAIQRFEQSIAE
ncbi:MAG: hypothetical protein CMN67_04145 [Sphingomonadaceae bacterium]|nr:hypothetical protein [Sphingomonadaceae bacterium]MBG76012.1 hypothetical protein [Erythrobacteraceae bacterium]|tara:strand:- start:65 stop:256 length:192 start_codon:yes stop_codon:yes gene_type:complete